VDKKKINMKKAYIVLFTSLIAVASHGQSLQRVVFNSTGGFIGGTGSTQMILSIGEPIAGVSENSELGLAQGFLGGSKTVAASPSGIPEVSTENATVYPNPFSSLIRIKSDATDIQVSVYNTMGQEVFAGAYPSGGIDLSHLTSGIYIIHATSNETIISTTKILKQ
jgi:hypothetical protein